MPSQKLRDDGVTDDEFDACVRRAKREAKANAYAYCNGMPNATALRSFAKGRTKAESAVVPLSMALRSASPLVESRRRLRLDQILAEQRLAGCERAWDYLTEQQKDDRRERVIDAVGIIVKARARPDGMETVDRVITDLTGGPLDGGRTMRPRYLLKGLEDQPLYKLLAATWKRMAAVAESQPEGQAERATLDAISDDPQVGRYLDEIERLYVKFSGRAA